ncbi:DNA helicase PcrA [Allofustis seminis]|uniref:DNA helicase PcrA n=1 Tax=Allofustis seminis TaxID=166939 RepID=UPI000378183D|nr:DNA helicase PcrA [Allofustis seminis]
MNDRRNILAQLNKEQVEAVQHTEGPLLIMAGAGSGKTRVLTHRIAYLLQEKMVNPWNILAITFTNKAASEMKERVNALIGKGYDEVLVSTFHALCVRILRRDIEAIGYQRNFTIADTSVQKTLIKQILKRLNLSEKMYNPHLMLSLISQAKNELINERDYKAKAKTVIEQRVAEVYEAYQRELRLAQSLDFDDLIMQTVRLFRQHPDTLAYYQRRFQYIHVDEYQDTNHAQYELVHLLAQRFRNLCVVGDSDQSIYGWRGADITNILEFEKDYPDAKVIYLEQNYRSTQTILDAANSVIHHNPQRRFKKLWTENESGDKIKLYAAQDEREEARFVVEKIEEIRTKDLSKTYGDFAILYRTNAMSRVMEEVLMAHQIPYHIVGGTGFYERKEIRDIMAYLTLVVNPTDNLSFQRVVNVPKRGIGVASVEKLAQAAQARNISLYEVALDASDIGLSARAANKVMDFAKMISDFKKMSAYVSVTELTETILDKTGYLDDLKAQQTLEADARIENIEEFYSATKAFDEQIKAIPEADVLLSFLTELSLLAPADQIEPKKGEVTLMTIHAAKGLEFPYVFIVGMEEGIFPNPRRDDTPEEIEEERRLAYVGITRAEKQLFLTHTNYRTLYGRPTYPSASRFIEEIDHHLIEEVENNRSPYSLRSEGLDFVPPISATSPKRGASHIVRPQVKTASDMVWNAGTKVRHAKWGEGTIVQISGEGDDMQLDIVFETVGLKKLLASFAPIEKM